MSQLNHPHDKFFREMFSRPVLVAEYIRYCLPEHIGGHLQVETLQQQKETYLDEELKSYASDVIYRCQYRNDDIETEVEITLLFEHKSYPEPFVWLQLMQYLVNALKFQFRAEKKKGKPFQFRPILPIVIYHGEEPWIKSSVKEDFQPVGEELLRFLPVIDYELKDLSVVSEQELADLGGEFLKSMLMAMKVKRAHNFMNLLRWIAETLPTTEIIENGVQDADFYRVILLYLGAGNQQKPEVMKAIQQLPQTSQERFVSLYEVLFGDVEESALEKGVQQGIKQGVEQGRYQETFLQLQKAIQKGLSVELIEETTSLPHPAVQAMIASLTTTPAMSWEEFQSDVFPGILPQQ